jgi:defect in organelle trafficking protein DotC
MLRKKFILVVASAVMVSCSSSPAREQNYSSEFERISLMSITSLSDAIKDDANEGNRLTTIMEVGKKAGRAAGLKTRNQQINNDLTKHNRYLSTIFNFEQLIVAGSYLPPRIDKVEGEIKKIDGSKINIIRQGYRIATEPTLITQRPTHLNYLYRLSEDEDNINPIGLPRRDNKEELTVWKEAVKKGWLEGMRHADIAFLEDINLLKRDFSGMLRYIELANKGIVAMPDISKKDRGVVMSSNAKMLNVGDEILSIDSSPLFKSIQLWEPRIKSLGRESENKGAEDAK